MSFCNDSATTENYTLSLHDALPICRRRSSPRQTPRSARTASSRVLSPAARARAMCCSRQVTGPLSLLSLRSEEHTSELQSRRELVCRLLLEKKKNNDYERPDCATET